MNAVRDRMVTEKDAAIEVALGKADGWAKTVRAGRAGVMLEDMPKFMTALGLKVVDRSKCCVDRSVFEAFKTLAGTAMTDPAKLQWDDES